MADESISIDNWIVATLTRDTQMQALIGDRVFPGLAPQGTPIPYIVYAEMSDVDTNSLGLERAMARSIYQIKSIGNSVASLKPVRSRADDLLHGANLLLTDIALKCARQGQMRAVEFLNNVRYDSLSGLYVIIAQPFAQA